MPVDVVREVPSAAGLPDRRHRPHGGCLCRAGSAANTFRFAFQGDLKSLDPYTLKETFTIAAHGAVYESLVTRDKDLKLVPGLAESWETPEPTRYRFKLRKNVKFHDGSPFTADDVIFSAERVRAPGSNFQTNVPADATFVKVDDHTVDMVLKNPQPDRPVPVRQLVHHVEDLGREARRPQAHPGRRHGPELRGPA